MTAVQQIPKLAALLEHGQSIWLDYITRSLVQNGDLQRLIAQDGLRGMTSNPTIFQKAIARSSSYDEQIMTMTRSGTDVASTFEELAIPDVQAACDLFLPLYQQTEAQDGFVSIEISPYLANNPDQTIIEARRLWHMVSRPNVMIKVPGTATVIPAIEQLLQEGININVTLLFSIHRHEQVMQSYINALEQRIKYGMPINQIASVASFFVSRVDTLVDQLLEERIHEAGSDPSRQQHLASLRGKTAIANAKVAYAHFQEIFSSAQFHHLARQGARVQRVLWASTSTKNPDYSDVYYVEELIGPDTINSMPPDTMEALLDHGHIQRTVDTGINEALATLAMLDEVGIDYVAMTHQLEQEGITKFADSYDGIVAAIEQKRGQRVS